MFWIFFCLIIRFSSSDFMNLNRSYRDAKESISSSWPSSSSDLFEVLRVLLSFTITSKARLSVDFNVSHSDFSSPKVSYFSRSKD